tara:strand:- start:411 stop:1028 length:618 start_codon:yes stop_codon:yes gene_type:complete
MDDRTGVLGGTFDPPHRAHLELAAAAREQLELSSVIFMPAGNPWRKSRGEVSPAAVRLEMVAAAVQNIGWATVSDMEALNPGPTYTAETLKRLKDEDPERSLWFILGADALSDMAYWHNPGEIVRCARLAVAARDGAEPRAGNELVGLIPEVQSFIDPISMGAFSDSSTSYRQRIGDTGFLGSEQDAAEAVLEIIRREGLYGNVD